MERKHGNQPASCALSHSVQERIEVRVASVGMEALGIRRYELVPVAEGVLPPFSAGSHIDVELAPGIVRQYSLCNSPHDRSRYVIAVLRDPHSRGGSVLLHDTVRHGSVLRVGTPRNLFPLVPDANHSVLFAGGIGVTPVFAMAMELHIAGRSFELHYCSRTPAHAAFREEILSSDWAEQAHLYFDDDPDRTRPDLPRILHKFGGDAHVYICGPEGFIEYVRSAGLEYGLDPGQLHSERFKSSDNEEVASSESFYVRIASSGMLVEVPPEKSVVQVLAEHGIVIPTSCEQGVCGTCVTRIVDGVPLHRDLMLSDEERALNDRFTPCCSRSKTRIITLDL